MTQKRLTTQNFMDFPFGRNAIGFDDLFYNLQHTANAGTSYPPYNIVKVDEDTHRIEIALAGFTRDDITITHEKNILSISGKIESETEEGGEDFIHKGISSKGFTREFTLGEYIEVTDAKMENGMLNIICKTIVPEELLPKTIKIS